MYYCNPRSAYTTQLTEQRTGVRYQNSVSSNGTRCTVSSQSEISDIVIRRNPSAVPMLSRRSEPQRKTLDYRLDLPSRRVRREEQHVVFSSDTRKERKHRHRKEEVQVPLQLEPERRPPTESDNMRFESPEGFAKCLVTDKDREEQLVEPANLPVWDKSRKRNSHRLINNVKYKQYDNEGATKAWNQYLKTGKEKNREQDIEQLVVDLNCNGKARHRVTIGDVPPKAVKKFNDQKPLYGSEEAERYCANAIASLLLAEKDIQCLQFVTGPIYPETSKFLENIAAMCDDLKMFNTHYKELKTETSKALQYKIGHKFTITAQKLPQDEVPFPPSWTKN